MKSFRMFALLGSILLIISMTMGILLLYVIEYFCGYETANDKVVFGIVTLFCTIITATIMGYWFKHQYRIARRKEAAKKAARS